MTDYIGFFAVGIFILLTVIAHKKRSYRLFFINLLCFSLFFIAISRLRQVNVFGDQVLVENYFGGFASLRKVGGVEQSVYLLVGEVNQLRYFSGYSINLPVLPMGSVEQLNEKFGDFRNCNSLGALGAFNSIVELKLIDADSSLVEKIEKAFLKSQKTSEDIFIRIDGTALELVENKMQGRIRDSKLNSKPIEKNILVDKIEFFVGARP